MSQRQKKIENQKYRTVDVLVFPMAPRWSKNNLMRTGRFRRTSFHRARTKSSGLENDFAKSMQKRAKTCKKETIY